MTEPYKQLDAERWDATQPGNLDVAQVVREIQVDTLDKLEFGAIASAVLGLATNPTAGDTVTVGGDIYEFVAAGGDVTADTNIAVERAAALADTRANLVIAINEDYPALVHSTIFKTDSTTPAEANGTENLLATVLSGDRVLLQSAANTGGTPVGANPSIALGETLTAAADGWHEGNVNMNTLGGRAASATQSAATSRAITADMITQGTSLFVFPFDVSAFSAQVLTAGGIFRLTQNDSFEVTAEGDVLLTLAGGGAPDIQATDVVIIHAWA